jgi:hypothetical protein
MRRRAFIALLIEASAMLPARNRVDQALGSGAGGNSVRYEIE